MEHRPMDRSEPARLFLLSSFVVRPNKELGDPQFGQSAFCLSVCCAPMLVAALDTGTPGRVPIGVPVKIIRRGTSRGTSRILGASRVEGREPSTREFFERVAETGTRCRSPRSM